MKLTCSRDELAEKLGVVARAVSTRTTVQVLSGIRSAPRRAARARRDRHGALAAHVARGRGDGEGAVVVPGACSSTSCACSRTRGGDRAPAGGGDGRASRAAPRATGCTRTAPRTSRACPTSSGAALHRSIATALLETVARVGRSASRDESRPVLTGHPRPLRGEQARDGRDRLLPPGGQGDAARGRRPSSRRSSRPARWRARPDRAGAATSSQLGVHENHVVFGIDGVWLTTRRIDGQFPNYKQLLPETFEHELALPRDELLDVVRRAAVMAQRNSPLRLRFAEGELTVSAQTQDVGEAQRVAAGAVRRRAARDRVQRRSSCATASTRSTGDELRAEADQPAAAGRDPGRQRRLLVPDHADQARRLALIVRDVSLRDFRSYARLELELGPASCSSWGRTAPARRTCSRRSTSARRASRRGRGRTRQLIRFGAEARAHCAARRARPSPLELEVMLRRRGQARQLERRAAAGGGTAARRSRRSSSRPTGWRS